MNSDPTAADREKARWIVRTWEAETSSVVYGSPNTRELICDRIARALTAAREEGRADQREVLRDLAELCDHANPGAFHNGVVHEGLDEGDVRAEAIIERARAAIRAGAGQPSASVGAEREGATFRPEQVGRATLWLCVKCGEGKHVGPRPPIYCVTCEGRAGAGQQGETG